MKKIHLFKFEVEIYKPQGILRVYYSTYATTLEMGKKWAYLHFREITGISSKEMVIREI